MIAKANTITRTVELISIANRIQGYDTNHHMQKEKGNSNLKDKNKKRNRDTYEPFVDINNGILKHTLSPGYEVTGENLFKEAVAAGENFVYEEYIIKLTYYESNLFRNLYDNLDQVDLISLPMATEQTTKAIIRFCEERKIYIDYVEMYDFLFKKYKLKLAVTYFQENITDMNFSEEKIIKIYNNLIKYKRYSLIEADEEVTEFQKIVKILSV